MLSEATVPMFDVDVAMLSYSFRLIFTILGLMIVGFVFLVSSRNAPKSLIRIITGIGWGVIIFTGILTISSVFMISQLTGNASRKAEVVNAAIVSEKLMKNVDYSFLAVDGNNDLRNYLLTDHMVCDNTAENIEVPAVSVDESNVIQYDLILSMTVDEENKTCSYSVNSNY